MWEETSAVDKYGASPTGESFEPGRQRQVCTRYKRKGKRHRRQTGGATRTVMAFDSLPSRVVLLYDEWLKLADPRTEDWPLMASPLAQTLIVIAYIYFVTTLGPRLMENRKPFDLKNAMVVYNFSIVGFSIYMIYEYLMSGWANGYSYGCDLVDYSSNPLAVRMAWTCWLYYFSKFIEMLDTIFFVLRKKTSQVTFLHVFHHSIMPFTWWFGVKFSAGGMGTFHAMLNCCVHVLMYSYYAVCAMGPAYQKYLWWKKYMTTIQLVQFVMVTVHIGQFVFMKDCPYKFPVLLYIVGLYGLIFLVLFLNFWYHAYTKGKRLPKVAQKSKALQNGNGVHHSNGVAKEATNGIFDGTTNKVANCFHHGNGIHKKEK
ncbi:unnamed protein product [Oncorhynchus mykiss]|uniref:Elongation of very long chain fatty acids protein 7 n=1 Tax=Oncorhynchus mykiss TaxID=8022 RepID=A0A060XK33_ONCMY|nr:unnamed protein product [Oncorhynchus mykiss]